jgi:hypothetical protein
MDLTGVSSDSIQVNFGITGGKTIAELDRTVCNTWESRSHLDVVGVEGGFVFEIFCIEDASAKRVGAAQSGTRLVVGLGSKSGTPAATKENPAADAGGATAVGVIAILGGVAAVIVAVVIVIIVVLRQWRKSKEEDSELSSESPIT